MKWYKPASTFVDKKFSRKKKWQPYFNLLQRFATAGMNYGNGSRIEISGEKNAIVYVASKLIGNNLVIFDVGANSGGYAFALLDVFANRAVINCFEPSLATFNKLSKNLSSNNNVVLHTLALSNSTGDAILYGQQANSAIASLVQTEVSEKYGNRTEEVVHLATVDHFCNANNITQIHFLKIDVEGNELKVLEGAKAMLQAKNIRFIQFEFGKFNIDSRTFFRDFWSLLHTDYRIYRIVVDGLYEIKKYTTALEIFETSNFLAELK